jgi:hypothetical protein
LEQRQQRQRPCRRHGQHGRRLARTVAASTEAEFAVGAGVRGISPQLQAQALNSVLQTAKSGACRPGVGNSAAAEPKEQSATPAAPPLRPGIKG